MGTNALFALIVRLVTLKFGSGWKTYAAAVGLVGLSLYLFSTGDCSRAVETLLAALAAFGIRQAIDGTPAAAAFLLAVVLLAGPAAVAGDGPVHAALPHGQAVIDPPPVWSIPPNEAVVETFDADVVLPALASEFWCKGTGVHDLWAKGQAGKGITVGVVDTGVQASHPLLAGRVGKARDFTGSGPEDRNGHGTHCVGVVATMAPAATVNSYKALGDSGSGSDEAIGRAIDAAAADGCQVVSLSLGSDRPGPYSGPAIDRALKAGVVVVAAAGNSGRQGIGYPGAHPGVVCVAAVDGLRRVASFSSRGRRLDVAGYGEAIRSTVPGNRTGTMSGTSMSCPNLAGQIGVALGVKRVGPAELRKLVRETALDLTPAGFDEDTGAGFARPAELVARLGPVAPPTDNERYTSFVEKLKNSPNLGSFVMAVGYPLPTEFAVKEQFPAGFKGITPGVYDCFLSNGSPSMLRRPDPIVMPARIVPAPVFGGCPSGRCPR